MSDVKEENITEEAVIDQPVDKTASVVSVLKEKLCRQYDLTLDELNEKVITIIDNEITLSEKKGKK